MINQKISIILSAFILAFCGNLTATEQPYKFQTEICVAEPVQLIEDHLNRCRKIIQGLVNDNQAVMEQYNVFAQTLQSTYVAGEGLIESDIHRIIDATIFAACQHRFQLRKDPNQTPYIIHPIGVADSMMTIGGVRDPDIIIAGLLHDTVEDTNTTFEDINSIFGSRVEGFVREVTDNKDLPAEETKRLQIENAFTKSAGAAQIKLADKLYNMSSVFYAAPIGWEKSRCDAYITWGKQVVDRLPWVNAGLKEAVDQLTNEYWEKSNPKVINN